ncbi:MULTISPECIES: type I-E CRISPR-associated protein Cas5/CasD [unclassified Streptomyces]|uniref:type I-E CRISPR-associated protein Cas5/CasD n=1 Tax=unclassified Streptomyces TaxID=2593676 RepID=UPI002ED2311F|nr:type I-E CRISPR-associated protein Cas5/CasD [Streptomyces sp. NBC_00891]WSY07384.1 type I-E CRISPR-associated protein Cas5/CasD [Streptomyces sp. NBC_00890]WSZ09009.1 type I-E CRISPR-associated protein Cas5/CasD [Streptomyces sp. NBC_00869]WSZ23492.1 type I-E CRISPR-associated protein Cas5/CasD [Streptomyces sp. NBC_00870]
MSVLTMRLAGPLQSWGASARFTRRTTESAPTKSGVIGLLAAAAGIERGDDEALAALTGLRFGVRIDQPGSRVRDFQTAHHGVTGASMPLSERFYLADAVFVAAVAGESGLLTRLHASLRAPVYPPFLGRRSCPPAQPVELGVRDGDSLQQALADEPWQAAAWYRRRHRGEATVSLTVLREADGKEADADYQRDQPLSFSAEQRRHALRTVVSRTVTVPNPDAAPRQAVRPRHEPFDALEESV